jgi:hypothetical protein
MYTAAATGSGLIRRRNSSGIAAALKEVVP